MSENVAGQTIGGYEIAEEIGRGGMAVVYRARQPQLDRWVALKVLSVRGDDDEEFLTRFRREAKAVAALRHPNILTIYDYGEDEGNAYIVMEYVPGGTLKALLTGEPLEWPEVASLALATGRALEYAHSQGIIHRDIKPANILMARRDWPLLADFGLAKLLSAPQGITQPGTSLGTPAYLSPELAVGEAVDHRSDIYGLGVLIYELLTGQVPQDSDSPMEIVLRRLREPPEQPSRLNPRVTPEIEAVVMRSLEREPDARYQTMKALIEDLESIPDTPGRPAAKAEPQESSPFVRRAPGRGDERRIKHLLRGRLHRPTVHTGAAFRVGSQHRPVAQQVDAPGHTARIPVDAPQRLVVEGKRLGQPRHGQATRAFRRRRSEDRVGRSVFYIAGADTAGHE